MSSYTESLLNDFLDTVKAKLNHLATELVMEKHKDLLSKHHQLQYRISALEKELAELKKEKGVIWEK